MKPKVKFIKQEHLPECRYCDGKGCSKCINGKFDNSSFHLIATSPSGRKIGFSVDQAGK